MTEKEIIKICSTEHKAKMFFKALRDSAGIFCKKCELTEHYWLITREEYKCKNCGHRTTLRSGTLLHASKLTYRDWIMAIYHIAFTNKDMPALEMQKKLGRHRYEPVWNMMKKIRLALPMQNNGVFKEDITLSAIAFTNEPEFGDPNYSIRFFEMLTSVLLTPEVKETVRPEQVFVKKEDSKFNTVDVIGSLSHCNKSSELTWSTINQTPMCHDILIASAHSNYIVNSYVDSMYLPIQPHFFMRYLHINKACTIHTMPCVYQNVFERSMPQYENELSDTAKKRYFGNSFFDNLSNNPAH